MAPPLPPPQLRHRIAGTDDAEWFENSGRMTADLYEASLARIGRGLTDFFVIYDFGAGCGRVTRWLLERAPHARIAASDIDAPAVAWMQEHLPRVDARVNDELPPSPWSDASFDLVLGWSVFTHLDARYQDFWLSELRRVTRPGAVLLLSVSGEYMWEWTMTSSGHANLNGLRELRAELDRKGFVHWRGDGWEALFPDFYHTSFHLPKYIRRHWSHWFDVVDVIERRDLLVQDLVVLRRR